MAVHTLVDKEFPIGRQKVPARCVCCISKRKDEIDALMKYFYTGAQFKFSIEVGWWWCKTYLFVCHF